MNPLSLLPYHWKKAILAVFWFAVFSFGTVKMLMQREWGYAAFCSVFVVLSAAYLVRFYAALTSEAVAADATPEATTPSGTPPPLHTGADDAPLN